MSAAPIEDIQLDLSESLEDAGDHDKFAHFVKRALLDESVMTGKPVQALCGKVWVPSRQSDNFPTCPECKEILEEAFPAK